MPNIIFTTKPDDNGIKCKICSDSGMWNERVSKNSDGHVWKITLNIVIVSNAKVTSRNYLSVRQLKHLQNKEYRIQLINHIEPLFNK